MSDSAHTRQASPVRTKAISPIDLLIDQACGYSVQDTRAEPTDDDRRAAEQLARNVMSDLRTYYPGVVQTRPTTWPIHLRNTIASKVARLLAERRT